MIWDPISAGSSSLGFIGGGQVGAGCWLVGGAIKQEEGVERADVEKPANCAKMFVAKVFAAYCKNIFIPSVQIYF